MTIALVTDSTAQLSTERAVESGVCVVPLEVIIGNSSLPEEPGGATPELVARSLREHAKVSTSRPAPAVFIELYARLAAEGATEIVSIHLSSELSGTVDSARLAAETAPVPVHVVDTRQVGPATGYAVLRAIECRGEGMAGEQIAAEALATAERAVSLFYVDTLEYLRRGGRIGAAAALLGSALAVKPLLTIRDGKVATRERVRTSSRALAKLAELAVAAAGAGTAEVMVAHLANPEGAESLAAELFERLADQVAGGAVERQELGAVLGAHVGPGMIAACVLPEASPEEAVAPEDAEQPGEPGEPEQPGDSTGDADLSE